MVRAGTTTAPNVEADLASNAEAEQLEEALRSLPANQRVLAPVTGGRGGGPAEPPQSGLLGPVTVVMEISR